MGPWNGASSAVSDSEADTKQTGGDQSKADTNEPVEESTPHEPLHVGEDDLGELGKIHSHLEHARQPDEQE